MTAPAIETVYAGCRFRSRLEARWAVFFDHAGIAWQYEPEGFMIGHLHDWPEGDTEPRPLFRPYLPDFRLPEAKCWVEVKGDIALLDYQLLAECVDPWGGGNLPGMDNTWSYNGASRKSDDGTWEKLDPDPGPDTGLLVLGDIPDVSSNPYPLHVLMQHYKGAYVAYAGFTRGGVKRWDKGTGWGMDSTCGQQDLAQCQEEFGPAHHGNLVLPDKGRSPVSRAYSIAKQARFEHGQTPRRPAGRS